MSMFARLFGSARSEVAIPEPLVAPQFERTAFSRAYAAKFYQFVITEAVARASLPPGIDRDGLALTVNDSFSPYKRGLSSLVIKGILERSRRYYRKEDAGRKDYIFKEVTDNSHLNEKGELTDPDVIELDFREFIESEVVGLLFETLSFTLQGMSNGATLGQAAILKIHKLSEMIANEQNMEPITAQLTQLNDSIRSGRPGVIDAESALEFPKYEVAPASEAAELIFSMIVTLTGVPASYIYGFVSGGLGDQAEGDERRLNSSIRRYFDNIVSGVLWAVYGKPFRYKTIIADVPAMVELFTWLETTTMITPEGKARILVDNTALDEEEIDTSEPEPDPVVMPGQSVPPEQQQQPGAEMGAGVA